ncbi:MAG: NAD-dependent deacylase [Ignavibacteriae bacterium]|nr:NAD-dependent deacylase [Ignavibacteria bacterium]MBI3365335.1 NAD-dependent deacylase [Ignavibacteriota bacterium]
MISNYLISKLKSAESIVAFTGAGMSAESGVPTFRGTDGIWKKFKPEELADIDAFIRNPDLVWEWYKHRKQVIAGVQPNKGHYALAEMERHSTSFIVVTQNIDNLHHRAGSMIVHELHGNIERNYCIQCGKYFLSEDILIEDHAPRCTVCGGLIRPDVVWFGEDLPVEAWNASVAAAERAGVFFSIGTSAVVYPAASLPIIAKRAGAYLVEINIEQTEISRRADEVLLGQSGEILPQLLDAYRRTAFHQQHNHSL